LQTRTFHKSPLLPSLVDRSLHAGTFSTRKEG
jgi:hypothetical protein